MDLHNPIIAETDQDEYRRKDPKWGTTIKTGLIVGRGKNKRVIDPLEVEELAKLWCTYKEMADFFQIPVETLKYNFSDIIEKGRSETKQQLRKAQLKVALSGNVSMLIWLGKNILGQLDKPEEVEEKPQLTKEQIDTRINQLLDKLKDAKE